MTTDVVLFLDFKEDARFSMEAYADELMAGLQRLGSDSFAVSAFRPRYPAQRYAARRWLDRYARYISYPRQVVGAGTGINHIIDHAYAHLLRKLAPERTVVTVHDMIPFLAWKGVLDGRAHHRPWLNEYTLGFLRRARCLITDSENTRSDLVRHLRIDERRVRTVPLGLSADFRVLPESKAGLRQELALPTAGKLLLTTGSQFYKNHATSVHVLRRVRQQLPAEDVKLVCMGRLTPDARAAAAEAGLESQVLEMRAAGRDVVIRLLNAVDCLLFPSLYEGFGWPPLEAMACGTPVVCSNAGSLREVIGSAAISSDALDVDAHAKAVLAVLTDSALAAGLRERGFAQARKFGWDDCVRGTMDVYRSMLS